MNKPSTVVYRGMCDTSSISVTKTTDNLIRLQYPVTKENVLQIMEELNADVIEFHKVMKETGKGKYYLDFMSRINNLMKERGVI